MYKLLQLLFILSISLADTKIVAISYFDNTSGSEQYNPLSKGLADMLITDLSRVKSIQIVEREKLESLLNEISLGEQKFINPTTAQKLGKGLGAEYILTGAFLSIEPLMRIDARLVNVETGVIEKANKVEGLAKDFFTLEKQLVNHLIKNLDIDTDINKNEDKKTNISFDAIINYSKSIDLFDKGYTSSASDLIKIILDESPDFVYADKLYHQLENDIQNRRSKISAKTKEKIASLIVDPSNINLSWYNDLNAIIASLKHSEKIQLFETLYNNFDLKQNELVLKSGPSNFQQNIGMFLTQQKIMYLKIEGRLAECIAACEYYLNRYENLESFMSDQAYVNTLETMKSVLDELMEKKKNATIVKGKIREKERNFNINQIYSYVQFSDFLGSADHEKVKNLFYNWMFYENVDTLSNILNTMVSNKKSTEAMNAWLYGKISNDEYNDIELKIELEESNNVLPNLFKIALKFGDETFAKDVLSFLDRYLMAIGRQDQIYRLELEYLYFKNQQKIINDIKIQAVSDSQNVNQQCLMLYDNFEEKSNIIIENGLIDEIIGCLLHYEKNWSSSNNLMWFNMVNISIELLSKSVNHKEKFQMFLDTHKMGFKQDIFIEGINDNDRNLNETIELIIKNQNTIISEANKKLRKKLSRINLLLEIASLNSQYKAYHDEIEIRKLILESQELNESGRATQYVMLFYAYHNVKNLKKMQEVLILLEKEYSHTELVSPNIESFKQLIKLADS
mgnify:CR=1 FL=1|tara:strand:- start:150 stop:2363 length:2214 start_codon:yes stop_codon:yes gene_type:complete